MTASSYDPVVLKRLALFIYENARKKYVDDELVTEDGPDKVDAIILTGDLATTGSVKDINRVKNFLHSPGKPRVPYLNLEREATLAAVVSPVWYLPGNHDRFVGTLNSAGIRYAFLPKFFDPGGRIFDNNLLDFQSYPVRILGDLTDASNRSSLRVVVIAADFTLKHFGEHKGVYGWLAQGLVDPKILDRLEEVTQKQIQEHHEKHEGKLCALWAIHFPPGYPHISSTNRLLNEDPLIKKAKQLQVKAILAGHTHEQVFYRKPAMGFDVLCCGSTTQFVPPKTPGANRFQILNITATDSDPDVVIQVESYKHKWVGEDGVRIAQFYREEII